MVSSHLLALLITSIIVSPLYLFDWPYIARDSTSVTRLVLAPHLGSIALMSPSRMCHPLSSRIRSIAILADGHFFLGKILSMFAPFRIKLIIGEIRMDGWMDGLVSHCQVCHFENAWAQHVGPRPHFARPTNGINTGANIF